MKKSLLFALFSSVACIASAYDAEIDGIFYNLTSKVKTAEVTYDNNTPYVGEVTVPSTINYNGADYKVVSVGQDAFAACEGLTKVTLSENIQSLGLRAFYFCVNLESVILPNSLLTIGPSAFHGCTALKGISFPDNLVDIGTRAFNGCVSLTSVTIPDGITILGEFAFYGCTGITSVSLPNGLVALRSAFQNCTGLKSIELPPGMQNVGSFYGCSSLEEIVIPNGVEDVGYNAFAECTSLKKVMLGNGINKIEDKAFYHCKNLEDFYCYSPDVIILGQQIFDEALVEYATLHVPDESIDNYASKYPWTEFGKILGINGTELTKCENPVISYNDGKLIVTCATEGAKCITTVNDTSTKTYYDNEIPLTLTYTVTAYATALGHTNSDVVTATLCWVNSVPETEGLSSDIKESSGNAFLIQNNAYTLTVSGLEEGTTVAIYDLDGRLHGTANAVGSYVTIDTNLQAESVAVIKIADKSIKVLLK